MTIRSQTVYSSATAPRSQSCVRSVVRHRTAVNGTVGEAWHDAPCREGCTGDSVRQALSAAGWHMPEVFGSKYPSVVPPPLDDVEPWAQRCVASRPAGLVAVHERVCDAAFSTRGGRSLRWAWTTVRADFGRPVGNAGVVVLDTVDLGNPEGGEPSAVTPQVEGGFDRLGRLPWLFSPRALSVLCRGELIGQALSRRADDPGPPPSIEAVWDDSGGGPPTDFDGVARHPRRLLGPDATGPTSLQSGAGYRTCTGQAGWNGELLVEDMVPVCDEQRPAASRAQVAVEARWIAAEPGVALATLIEGPISEPWGYRIAVLRIVGAAGLAAAGRWIGPRRRGTGGWVSPWLELSPRSWPVTVLHTSPTKCFATGWSA